MLALPILAAALSAAGPLPQVNDKPLYEPPPSWAKMLPVPTTMKPTGAAADILLWSVQSRLSPNDDEVFTQSVTRINTSDGLDRAGSLIETWNPLTETLIIHRARIVRDGKIIDLLADGRRFTVLRRETSLEAAMIDGELTATLQPEGVRAGDVIDIAFTLIRKEPALGGRSEAETVVGHSGAVGLLSVSAVWPQAMTFKTWKTDDLPEPTRATHDGWTEVSFQQKDAVSPEPPKGAGSHDQLFGVFDVGDFASWNTVSATAYPLYAKAAALGPDSPLKAEAARIRAAYPDPKSRALAALKLVESQTRYLYVALDAGGFTPAPADLTWTRRFGDCKGKSALLLALLKELGIEAEAALANATDDDGLDHRLPQMGAFDHVLVRAMIDGRTYWLDGTRMGDENLDVMPTPTFSWALPLRAQGAALERIEPEALLLPREDLALRVDLSDGVDKPAKVHMELTTRGDAALWLDLGIRQASKEDADRILRRAMVAARPWIKPDKVTFSYDPQKMEAHTILDGSGVAPFGSLNPGEDRRWIVEGSTLAAAADLTRPSDYHRNAPYQVGYPSYDRISVEAILPDNGKGFQIYGGGTTDQTLAGVDFAISAIITGDRMVMVGSRKAVAQSFPASEAEKYQGPLRELSKRGVALGYTPPAPTAKAADAKAPDAKTGSAEAEIADLSDKARQAFHAKDYAAADTGFTAAIARRPSAKLYYDRAAVRLAMQQDALAQADLRMAIKLDPDDPYAAYALGQLALQHGDGAEAGARFKVAADHAKRPNIARMIGVAYEAAGRYAEAFPYWDRVAAMSDNPADQARALNVACWDRARADADLKGALDACNRSLDLVQDAANTLDSRGLVNLKLGALDKAMADYDASLAKRPRSPTALYGRALAEARLGRTTQAGADRAAAEALDPKVAASFANLGPAS